VFAHLFARNDTEPTGTLIDKHAFHPMEADMSHWLAAINKIGGRSLFTSTRAAECGAKLSNPG